MFGYAFLLALKSKYGFRVFLEGRHLEHLSYFFENIDQVETLNNLCDEGNSFPWTNSTEIWTDLGKPDLKIGQCMDYYKNVSKYVTLGKPCPSMMEQRVSVKKTKLRYLQLYIKSV